MNPVSLYLLFLKYGLLCFGGGYMLVPLITADLVGSAPGQLSPAEFANLVSLAQITPGPVGLNTATYLGFTRYGLPGALAASFGIVTPALVLVLLAVKLLKRYENSLVVRGFLAGMRPASFGLILAAAVIFSELSIFSAPIPWSAPGEWFGPTFQVRFPALLITIATVFLLQKTKVSFLLLLLLSGVFGAFFLA